MGKFEYTAVNSAGTRETGSIESANEAAAISMLESSGLLVYALGPANNSLYGDRHSSRRSMRSKISLTAQAAVAEEFAVLLAAGLSVPRAVSLVGSGQSDPKARQALNRVSAGLTEGRDLGAAFSAVQFKFEPVFGDVLIAATGGREAASLLFSLARRLRAESQLRSKLVASLVYPAILFVGAILLLCLLSVVVAPGLVEVFQASNQSAPAFIASLANIGTSPLLLPALILMVLLLIVPFVILRHRLGQFVLGASSLIPGLAKIWMSSSTTRAFSMLALLLESGIPTNEAFRKSATAARHPELERFLLDSAQCIEVGGNFSAFLTESQPVAANIRELLAAGVEANALSKIARSISSAAELQAARSVETILQLLPVAMTLFAGSLVGSLVYLTMDAVLSLNELSLP